MIIKMLVGLSGPAYTLSPGDEYEFPDDEATRLIVAEYAVPVAAAKIERAVLPPVKETRAPSAKTEVKANVVSGDGNSSAGKRTGKRRGR